MEIDIKSFRAYANIELLAKQMVEGFITGLHKSPYHGFSVEFAEHTLYNAGESTKHIDWKVFAKTDRLYTKKYEEETNLRCMLVVDNSSSMYYPEESNAKITFGVVASACLSYMLQRQRDAVGLCTFSSEIEWMSPIKSTSKHIHTLMLHLQRMLSAQPKGKKTAVAEVLHLIAEKTHRRSLVVIFSDMMDNSEHSEELFSALQHLKHNQHEVLLFHVYDSQTELQLDFPERPTVFVDVESGAEVKAQPSQVRELYRERILQKYKEVRIKCGQYKIDFIEADCRKPIDQILQAYLIKRGKMR